MKKRQRLKLLMVAAEKQANHLKGFGYSASIAKLNNKILVVRAENAKEEYKIFVNSDKPPYNTAKTKKGVS